MLKLDYVEMQSISTSNVTIIGDMSKTLYGFRLKINSLNRELVVVNLTLKEFLSLFNSPNYIPVEEILWKIFKNIPEFSIFLERLYKTGYIIFNDCLFKINNKKLNYERYSKHFLNLN